ncbi:hypothetical protein IAQ61_007921 [Plenodomus lingam]|uniref:uncharacterized protein n=1 Tax=Leptosphaeria maculans TaxID=5022 RepID=UPI00332D8D5F|nr:hypothetical protein IAQ61_007921 [Plenodomus lingam]
MLYRLGLQPYNAAHLILLSIITSTTKYKLSNIGCFFKRCSGALRRYQWSVTKRSVLCVKSDTSDFSAALGIFLSFD